jgi:hypothetical protein
VLHGQPVARERVPRGACDEALEGGDPVHEQAGEGEGRLRP